MSEPCGISIIVVNFDYGCSLPAAIDSTLSQESFICGFANRRTTPATDSRRLRRRVRPVRGEWR